MNFLKTILLFDSLVLVLKNSFFYLVVTSLVSLCLLKFSIVFQITELFLSSIFKCHLVHFLVPPPPQHFSLKKFLIFSQKEGGFFYLKKWNFLASRLKKFLYFLKKSFLVFWEMELCYIFTKNFFSLYFGKWNFSPLASVFFLKGT